MSAPTLTGNGASRSTATRSAGDQSLVSRIWQYRSFYAFIAPFFISFLILGLYPLVFSLYLSFVDWDGLTTPVWVGLGNFKILFRDELFYSSLKNTLLIGLYYVPPMFVLAFGFAVLLNGPVTKFRSFFRAAVFIPCITPMVVIAIVFSLMFGMQYGLFNFVIRKAAALFGVQTAGVQWLQSEEMSKISVAILVVWRWTGYNMILMLAGLQGISHELYEAARLDGASRLQQMRHVTLPLMRPTFVFCAIMSLLGTVYMFDEVFVLTGGGPGVSSTNFGLYLFNITFNDFRFGYASAAAYAIAFVVFVLSITVFRWGQKANT